MNQPVNKRYKRIENKYLFLFIPSFLGKREYIPTLVLM